MKVARGRSWQPEIGMVHASRGRRSGNKGVGARWRGRFRIFSARHCSRTKVSHAENSGMTMLFFSLEVAPVSEGDSFTPSGEDGTRGFDFLFCGGGAVAVCFEGGCGGMCWPVDRPATHAAAGAAARGVRGGGGLGDCFTPPDVAFVALGGDFGCAGGVWGFVWERGGGGGVIAVYLNLFRRTTGADATSR